MAPNTIVVDNPIFKRKSNKRSNDEVNEIPSNTNSTSSTTTLKKSQSSFNRHFSDAASPHILRLVDRLKAQRWVPTIDTGVEIDNNDNDNNSNEEEESVTEDISESLAGGIPLCFHLEENGLKEVHNLASAATLEEAGVKRKLASSFVNFQGKTVLTDMDAESCAGPHFDKDDNGAFTPLQWQLYKYASEYNDLFFPGQTTDNSQELLNVFSLHVLNHIMKTRDLVTKNNERLAGKRSMDDDDDDNDNGDERKPASEDDSKKKKKARMLPTSISSDECRDQGYTRPKVLILAPFRNTAVDIVRAISKISGATHVDGMDKFEEHFDVEEDALDTRKSQDYQRLFKGNIDDCFKVGVKFMNKKMKLFSPFYSSDIIIASPLGLRLVIEGEEKKKEDYDFLSSIEVVWAHDTDVFLMQNWEHVKHVFEHLNLAPTDAHGCDFSRVRSYYLDGNAKYIRQTILSSKMVTPEIAGLFNNDCKNVAGKIKIDYKYKGEMSKILPRAKEAGVTQMFYRIPGNNLVEADEKRFLYFVKQILPQLNDSLVQQRGTMIFIPSYFDFVRVRNYLKDHKYNFVGLSEYTPTADISRGRGDFFTGKVSYMLYTERFHFFRRYKIKGVRHLVFYGLPEYSDFYDELVDMVVNPGADKLKLKDSESETSASTQGRITATFMIFDKLKLNRIMGNKRTDKMLSSLKDSFMFA